jgi:hypothetical protein
MHGQLRNVEALGNIHLKLANPSLPCTKVYESPNAYTYRTASQAKSPLPALTTEPNLLPFASKLDERLESGAFAKMLGRVASENNRKSSPKREVCPCVKETAFAGMDDAILDVP